MPKVSVILPTHNRALMLGRAVASVLLQSFADFELLVVDDASNDDTAHAIQGFTDPRIKYIRHTFNRGEAESRNTGIRIACGEYIAYLDDDDEWLPEKLAKQVSLMESSTQALGLVYTGMHLVELATRKTLSTWIPQHRGCVLEPLLEKNFPLGATALLRMECFRTVGTYDPSIPYGPDWEMSIRIARRFNVEAIPEPLYRYSIHPKQLTANPRIRLAGLQKVLELHSDLFAGHPKAHAHQLVNLGLLHYLCGNPREARASLRRGVLCYPLWVRPYKLYLLSFLSADFFNKLLAFRERTSLDGEGLEAG